MDELDEDRTVWPERMWVASASGDRSIAIWSSTILPKEGSPVYGLEDFSLAKRIDDAHETEVNCIAWNPTAPSLASCDDSGCIKLWKLTT